MIHKISGDWVYPISSPPIQNGVIIYDDDGKILAVDTAANHDQSEVRELRGILLPGFVNTHCHLELSHMKGKIDTGTGLIAFITNVIKHREARREEIIEAIYRADQEMYHDGIMAVGDISNKVDTAECKNQSKISYYTFVEMFDFLNPQLTDSMISQYEEVYDKQSTANHNKISRVPHAPYTVSPKLFEYLTSNNKANSTVSIHNQETPSENELFEHGSGQFKEFYTSMGLDLSFFKPNGKPSINYAMKYLNPSQRTLFVHNTMTSDTDIDKALSWSSNTFWTTCANANLYIENRLPDYKIFIDNKCKMTIGTDSLTSNWKLSVLSEMQTIKRYQSFIDISTLFRWATLNGAESLGYEERLGSFDKGKVPGINLLYMPDARKDFDLLGARIFKVK